MPQRVLLVVLALLVLPAGRVTAQRSGSTTLVLRVAPESRLEPRQAVLNFRVSADGASDVTTQSATVSAWVRPLSGQTVRLTADLSGLQGPDGIAAAGALQWAGSRTSAAGGARAAACTSGVFDSAPQDLVQGWGGAGSLTCAVNFQLSRPGLSPGLYSGTVTFAIQ